MCLLPSPYRLSKSASEFDMESSFLLVVYVYFSACVSSRTLDDIWVHGGWSVSLSIIESNHCCQLRLGSHLLALDICFGVFFSTVLLETAKSKDKPLFLTSVSASLSLCLCSGTVDRTKYGVEFILPCRHAHLLFHLFLIWNSRRSRFMEMGLPAAAGHVCCSVSPTVSWLGLTSACIMQLNRVF